MSTIATLIGWLMACLTAGPLLLAIVMFAMLQKSVACKGQRAAPPHDRACEARVSAGSSPWLLRRR
jgi:hypothetical protein